MDRGLRILKGYLDPNIVDKMAKKMHPTEIWDHAERAPEDTPSLKKTPAVVKDTKPFEGPRGFHAGPIKKLFTANAAGGVSANKSFGEQRQAYLCCEMPPGYGRPSALSSPPW